MCRVVDRLHKDSGGELVQRLGHLLGVFDRLNHRRDEGADVTVLTRVERLECCVRCPLEKK